MNTNQPRPYGSSPLARGLPPHRARAPGEVRIIPARARFTRPPVHVRGRLRDHPRSRGVYWVDLVQPYLGRGSSPLARGLRRLFRRRRRPGRIIPARAGFTRRPRVGHERRPDHPRSRGVYSSHQGGASSPAGSSPLARGLLCSLLGLSLWRRIIPARAGFTPGRDLGALTNPDHPRSRGVYELPGGRPERRGGSSPLARGLHLRVLRAGGLGRIIPARAGFTSARSTRGDQRADHPRSRGVYTCPATPTSSSKGSSPLARGLHEMRARYLAGARIIPARAGFTRIRPRVSGDAGDHPRSRGVYVGRDVSLIPPTGSSPLARGLRLRPGGRPCGRGIIPARAGFTPDIRAVHPLCGDHPRSRGVYPPCPGARLTRRGSSPLARGLRPRCGGPREGRRIIPARAGFTPGRSPAISRPPGSSPLARGLPMQYIADQCGARIIPARAGFTQGDLPAAQRGPDHPRSRGVYRGRHPGAGLLQGSSPLARGLPQEFLQRNVVVRIIPARAGFTDGRLAHGSRRGDHPRSRGVYR